MNEFAVVPVNATFRITSNSANQLQIFNNINFQNLAPRKQTWRAVLAGGSLALDAYLPVSSNLKIEVD